jgi:hypothetical protein
MLIPAKVRRATLDRTAEGGCPHVVSAARAALRSLLSRMMVIKDAFPTAQSLRRYVCVGKT